MNEFSALVGKKEDKEKLSDIYGKLIEGWRPTADKTLKTVICIPTGEQIDLLELCYVLCKLFVF